MIIRILPVFITALTVLTGCSEPALNSGVSSASVVTDSWVGRWNGPEGTYLLIAGDAGDYAITIANLDGPRTFQGSADGEQIRFERDGTQEMLRATNGTDTGMKWLSEKVDCLTVRAGEGYCRD